MSSPEIEQKAARFEQHRRTLTGLAYRMSGSIADAHDLVQETYLKWRGVDAAQIRDVRAWLVTACLRLALNHLNSARRRRETYVGTWLPEPYVADEGPGPAQRTQIDDSVSLALLFALEKLQPAERATFLLHDVFDYDFEEIARVLEKRVESCRKLASRARAKLRQDRPRLDVAADDHQRLVTAFLNAARAGDLAGLRQMLTDDALMHSDGGGRVPALLHDLVGAEAIATFLLNLFRRLAGAHARLEFEPRWFNGAPGVLLRTDGQLATAFAAEVREGRITRLFAIRNPDKLTPFAAGGANGSSADAEPASGGRRP